MSPPPVPAREAYRRWAPSYEAENGVTLLDALAAKRLTPPRFQRLLDAGCGTGWRLPAERGVGVDLVPEMIHEGRARGHRRLAVGDVRALPFRNDGFDVVWCRLVLSYVDDPGMAYRELARVASPGACLLVTDLHPDAAAAGFAATFRDVEGALVTIHRRVLERPLHLRLAERAGFRSTDVLELQIGPEIRHCFAAAGELRRYERQLGMPLLQALRFERVG